METNPKRQALFLTAVGGILAGVAGCGGSAPPAQAAGTPASAPVERGPAEHAPVERPERQMVEKAHCGGH